MPWQSPISPGVSWYEASVGERPEYAALDGRAPRDVQVVVARIGRDPPEHAVEIGRRPFEHLYEAPARITERARDMVAAIVAL